MILYLLVPALVLGDVEIGNTTEEEGAGRWGMNLTFSPSSSNHSWSQPKNVTWSLQEDRRTGADGELRGNMTSGVVTEDQESFQDEENLISGQHCHRDLLLEHSSLLCGGGFHAEMLELSPDDWCVLENVIRPYSDLTLCLENLSHVVGCFFPNSDTQDFFLHIHSMYFQNCQQVEEQLLADAPHGVVVALTLVPVSLIPILVYVVVWKSKAAT
ncbi:receptor activity-modifying protein 2 [Salarias fasciatus]|uniref:Receptor activity-modifying protein 2-like n=1 Tax=Salarias fasciatus TaxID=181472 RepID=A0A672ITE8_SALFA|nr:receptor activity-modifying protein 2-like [Salarias fasciatus]